MLLAMPKISQTLQDFRARFHLSKAKASKVLGVSINTIRSLETGVDATTGLKFTPRDSTIRHIAARMTEFGYPMSYEELISSVPMSNKVDPKKLMVSNTKFNDEKTVIQLTIVPREGMTRTGANNMVLMPQFGPVSCGDDLVAQEFTDMIEVPAKWALDADAVFKVSGNCLSARRILDGDDLLVARLDGERPNSGDVVVVVCDGSYVAKIYRRNNLGEYLESHELGRDPEPHVYPDGSRIVGRVVRGMISF